MSLRAVALTAALAIGCGGDKSATGPSATNADTTDDSQRATTEPDQSELPRATLRAYRKRLRAGRKLARNQRWGEAAVEFEAALVAIPGDGRASSELGWAAFQAGDYDRARRANADAVRASSNPKVRAASFYNLGRVAEARGDKQTAAQHYRASLALRPHDTVQARLDGLGAVEPPMDATPDDAFPCGTPQPSAEQVCNCLGALHGDDADPRSGRCELGDQLSAGAGHGLAIASVTLSDLAEFNQYLVYQSTAGWAAIDDLGVFYEGGFAGVLRERSITQAQLRPVGDRSVLWIEVTEQGSDRDQGINEYEQYQDVVVVLCLPVGEAPPRCPLQLPLRYKYLRDLIDKRDTAASAVGDLQTAGLPLEEFYDLSLSLQPTGTAHLVLQKGDASRHRALLGPHKLWQ